MPRRGASNEYPQHIFAWRNKKDISIFRDEKSALSIAMHVTEIFLYFQDLCVVVEGFFAVYIAIQISINVHLTIRNMHKNRFAKITQ